MNQGLNTNTIPSPSSNHDVESGLLVASIAPRPPLVRRTSLSRVCPTDTTRPPSQSAPMTPVRESTRELETPGSASKEKESTASSNMEAPVPQSSPPRETTTQGRAFCKWFYYCMSVFKGGFLALCTCFGAFLAFAIIPSQETWTWLQTQGVSFLSAIDDEKRVLLGDTAESFWRNIAIYGHIACSYVGGWMLVAWLVTLPVANNLPRLDMFLHAWHSIVDVFFIFDCICKRLVSKEPFCSFGIPRFTTVCSGLAILPFEALGLFRGTRTVKVWLNFLNLARCARLFGHRGFHNRLFGRDKPLRVFHGVLAIFLAVFFSVHWTAFSHLGFARVTKCGWLQRGRLEEEPWPVQLLWAVYYTIGYNGKAHGPSP